MPYGSVRKIFNNYSGLLKEPDYCDKIVVSNQTGGLIMPIFGKEHDNHFTYSATDNAPPFPLDYTTGELLEKWDISRSLINKRMFFHKQFSDFFQQLQFVDNNSSKEEKANSSDKPYSGLPPELEPFMRIYMEEFDRAKIGKSSIDMDQFIPDLCVLLHSLAIETELKEDISQPKTEKAPESITANASHEPTAPDDRYWLRHLYENKGFQEAIIKSYWTKEYDTRTKTVKELFQKMPYDFQIQTLIQNICFLDTQIASMLQTIEWNKAYIPEPNQTSLFLKTFPAELLEHFRAKVPSTNHLGRTTFSVRNFDIPDLIIPPPNKEDVDSSHSKAKTRDLLSYLIDIAEFNNPEAIKKAVRPYYLHEICQIPEKPPFLDSCLYLQNYLDSNAIKANGDDDITKYVHEKSKELYQAALRFDPFPAPSSSQFRGDHLGSMIDQLIFNMYNNFAGMYGQEFDYLRYWLNFRPSEKEMSHISPTVIPNQEEASKVFTDIYNLSLNLVYSISGKTLKNPGMSWDTYAYVLRKLVGNDIYSDYYVFYYPLSDECIAHVSRFLEKNCREAYACMDLDAPDWISEDIFKIGWKHYSQFLYSANTNNAQSNNNINASDNTEPTSGTEEVRTPENADTVNTAVATTHSSNADHDQDLVNTSSIDDNSKDTNNIDTAHVSNNTHSVDNSKNSNNPDNTIVVDEKKDSSNAETACTVTDPQVTGTIISSNDSTNASCTACNPNDAQSSNITKKTPTLPVMVGNEDLYLLAALMVQRIYHAYQINCNAAISSYQTYIGFMQKQK